MIIYKSQKFENLNLEEFTVIVNLDMNSQNLEKINIVSFLENELDDENVALFVGLQNNDIVLQLENNFVNTNYTPCNSGNQNLIITQKENLLILYIDGIKIFKFHSNIRKKINFIVFGDDENYNLFGKFQGKINGIEILDRCLTSEEAKNYFFEK